MVKLIPGFGNDSVLWESKLWEILHIIRSVLHPFECTPSAEYFRPSLLHMLCVYTESA